MNSNADNHFESSAIKQQSASTPYPPALPYVLPFIVFMLLGSFYPNFSGSYENDLGDAFVAQAATPETWTYIVMIGVQLFVAGCFLTFFRKTYLHDFPLKVSPWSIVLGVVGIALWIWLAGLGVEHWIFEKISLLFGREIDASRPSFNPYTIDDSGVRALFLVMRFAVLAMIVPIVEELFIRGWLVRWIDDPNFQSIRLTSLTIKGLLAASIYGVMTHPMEAIAAFAWFGMVTLWARRTGSLWDCVIIHAVTNLLLGIYVVKFEQWQLW